MIRLPKDQKNTIDSLVKENFKTDTLTPTQTKILNEWVVIVKSAGVYDEVRDVVKDAIELGKLKEIKRDGMRFKIDVQYYMNPIRFVITPFLSLTESISKLNAELKETRIELAISTNVHYDKVKEEVTKLEADIVFHEKVRNTMLKVSKLLDIWRDSVIIDMNTRATRGYKEYLKTDSTARRRQEHRQADDSSDILVLILFLAIAIPPFLATVLF